MSSLPAGITVDIQQIADIAGVGRSAVGNWRKRHDEFPVPDSSNRFDLHEVERWLIENGKIDSGVSPEYVAWSLVDALRSVLDADASTSLLIAILVYLHASDPSTHLATRAVELDVPDTATWRRVSESSSDGSLSRALVGAAETIEDKNPALANLVAPGLSQGSHVDGALLRNLVDSFDHAADEAETPRFALFEDVVGRARDLDRFRGEFATPHEVTELMVRLGGWHSGTVVDLACGQGGLLLSTAIHPDRAASERVQLIGYDINPDVLRVARSRFFLYGVAADLRQADVFRIPQDQLPRAELVLVDPPLGVPDWGDADIYLDKRWSYGMPPRQSADLAWTQLALQALIENGRAVVATTEATTSRGGAEAQIRRSMIEAGVIEAVIQLPRRLRTNTSVPLALWILHKSSAAPHEVLFIDASTLGTTGRSQHSLDERDIDRIVSAVEAHDTGAVRDDEIAWTVDRSEILANDAVLTPNRYRAAPSIDVDETRRRANELRSKLPAAADSAANAVGQVPGPAQGGTATAAQVLRLGDIATILRGTVPAKPTDSDEGVPFFGIAEISSGGTAALRRVDPDDAVGGRRSTAVGSHTVILEPGDVVVALMSNIGQSVLVTSRHAGAVLGRECAVIRPADQLVSAAWIYVWTQSVLYRDQALRHTSGTTMPRLSYRALQDFTIPVPSEAQQQHTKNLLEAFDHALGEVGQVRSFLTELRTLQIELMLADLEDAE